MASLGNARPVYFPMRADYLAQFDRHDPWPVVDDYGNWPVGGRSSPALSPTGGNYRVGFTLIAALAAWVRYFLDGQTPV